MKVSIITAVFNNPDISSAIESVLSQDYNDIEYIVIDGKSTDNTLDVINKYSSKISKIVSEKDEGIYDALNKGISLATGEVIAFLHSDDFYASNSVISDVAALFKTAGTDSVYGDLLYVDRKDTKKIIRYWKAGKFYLSRFYLGWMPPHPSFFTKKSSYEKYGNFNKSFHTAADYELMLRFLFRYKISTAWLPKILVCMRVGGVSNSSMKNRVNANMQDREAWTINGLKPRWYTLLLKPLLKIPQFVNLPKFY